MTTAADVHAMLTRHYLPESRPPGGILAAEIGSPDGRRQADAIWAPTTSYESGRLIGHEIKVARSDVIAELRDLTKADAWARYCDQWWLTVSDPALVDGLDIPEQWGIMAPPSGRRTRSMTVVRKAPELKPVDKAAAFQRLMKWKWTRDLDEIHRLQSTLDYRDRELASKDAQLREARLSASGQVDPGLKAAQMILDAVNAKSSERAGYSRWTQVDEKFANLVADVVVDRQELEGVNQSLRRHVEHLIRTLRSQVEPSKYLAAEIEKAMNRKESA